MSDVKKTTEQETVVTINPIVIIDMDHCEKIRGLSGTKNYQNTQEGSRYEGKSFRTFLYAGKAFTVPTDDKFCTDYDNDNLFEVELESTELGYNFIGHRTISRAIATHKTKVTMKAYTVEFVQTSRTIDLEELA